MKKCVLFGLITVFILVWTLPVTADKLKSVQQQKNVIQSEIKDLNKKKQEILNEKKKLENDNKILEKRQNEESQEYKQLLDEVKALEEEILKINEAIKESEDNYNKRKELLKTRLRVMSENSGFSLMETLIKSKSLTDFFERLELVSLISKKDRQLVEELRIAKMDVEYKKQLKEEEKNQVADEVGQKRDRISELKASRADLKSRIEKSEVYLKRLNDREDELLRQSREMDNIIKSLSKKTRYIGGNMQWPVPGRTNVVSGYGMRKHPILKKYKMHTGIDIDANKGDPIVAANNGTVIIAKYQSGYGNTVVIDHGGGITTLYAHCSKLLVKVGDEVKAGQKIALVGSTGLSTGPHLHFEVRKDGKTRDPLAPIK